MTKLETKVVGEPIRVPLHRLIEAFCGHSVEYCEVAVEDDPVPSKDENALLDMIDGYDLGFGHKPDCNKSRRFCPGSPRWT